MAAFGWILREEVVTKVGTEHVGRMLSRKTRNFAKNFSHPAWIAPYLPDFFLAGWRFLYHAFLLAIPAMVFSPDDSSIRLDDCAANSQHRQPGGDGKVRIAMGGTGPRQGAGLIRTFKEGVSEWLVG